jgi:hypothetical protein
MENYHYLQHELSVLKLPHLESYKKDAQGACNCNARPAHRLHCLALGVFFGRIGCRVKVIFVLFWVTDFYFVPLLFCVCAVTCRHRYPRLLGHAPDGLDVLCAAPDAVYGWALACNISPSLSTPHALQPSTRSTRSSTCSRASPAPWAS